MERNTCMYSPCGRLYTIGKDSPSDYFCSPTCSDEYYDEISMEVERNDYELDKEAAQARMRDEGRPDPHAAAMSFVGYLTFSRGGLRYSGSDSTALHEAIEEYCHEDN